LSDEAALAAEASASHHAQRRGRRQALVIIMQFDSVQQFSKDNTEATMKALGVVSKGAQAIAVETTEFAKKSFEQSTATLEKLAGVRSLDKAVEIQTDYLKTAYEGFVAQATKMGELYANLAKEAYRPLEGLVAKQGVAAQAAK
jgi:hypothetical protein